MAPSDVVVSASRIQGLGIAAARNFRAGNLFFEEPFAVQIEYLPLLAGRFVAEHSHEVEALRGRAAAILTGGHHAPG